MSRGLSGARFRTLDEWLAWQETLHPRAIDLGLERVDRVHRHMGGARPAPLVITVAGTNGKGSTVALLEAIYLAAGYRVGSYTSPYLLRYNERVRIDGREVSDRQLCDTFARVDAARGDDTLTYFEFGTLAALDLFAAADLDIALLEVGMGGRLDAVNIIDADVALVTSIGVDHTAWLGDGPDDIAREKAGIFRAGRAAISADPDAPAALAIAARETGADWYAAGARFRVVSRGDGWDWKGPRGDWMDLPRPAAAGVHQLNNAAGALMAVQYLSSRLPVSREAVAAGLARAGAPGRIQRIGGDVEQWLDVAHNPQAAAALAGVLADDRGRARTLAVIGMMADKDCRGFVTALSGQVDLWFATALQMPRASDPESLARCIEAVAGPACVRVCRDMAAAKRSALEAACAGDRVLVCGSFYTVAEWLNATGEVVG